MKSPDLTAFIDNTPLDKSARAFFDDNSNRTIRTDLAMSAARMGSWYHFIQDDQVWGDKVALDLLGFDQVMQPWSMADFVDILHPDDRARVGAAVQATYDGQTPYYDVTFRVIPRDQSIVSPPLRWLGARGQVVSRDEDGSPVKLCGVTWDMTEAKAQEERLSLLASEMDHRVKNAFAVIRALINIGADMKSDKASFADTLRNQVEAMATAHTLSAQIARKEKDVTANVALADVLNTALAPWIEIAEGSDTMVTLTCDPKITLPPNKIAAFAMLFYELSTNATKYGPLGERGGALVVSAVTTEDDRLIVDWREYMPSPLDVTEITDSDLGFGDVLLNHCANNLGAEMTRKITKRGLRMHLEMAAH